MKRLITLFLVFVTSAILYSHPASKMNAVFDSEKSLLSIDFEHQVKDRLQHFIFNVSVELNGKEIINQKLHSQEDLMKGSLVYKITDAKAGDKLIVKARCNKGGMTNFDVTVKNAEPVSAPVKAAASKDVKSKSQVK